MRFIINCYRGKEGDLNVYRLLKRKIHMYRDCNRGKQEVREIYMCI